MSANRRGSAAAIFGADEWQQAPSQVQDVCEKHTIDYLFDTPLLPNSLD